MKHDHGPDSALAPDFRSPIDSSEIQGTPGTAGAGGKEMHPRHLLNLVLESTGAAIVLLDADDRWSGIVGDIHLCEQYLRRGRNGGVRAVYPGDTTRLADLLQQADGSGDTRHAVLRPRSPGLPHALAKVLRSAPAASTPPGKALLLRQLGIRTSWSPALLQDTFGLTTAELRLARALVEGLPLAGYAASQQRSINTVRSQLRNLFRKTGTHRQGELIALLAVSGTT
ncbi:MAG: helix-turn-helix transcriptional regulator [Gammaproteobacteria bacterium]